MIKVLIYTYNFSNLKVYNLAYVPSKAVKFHSKTHLSLRF